MAETKKKTVKKEEEATVEKAPKKAAKAKKAEPKEESKAVAKAKKAEAKAPKAETKVEKKEEAPKKEVHEARCIAKGVRVTPRKLRLVVDLVRGKDVAEALGILKVLRRSASDPVYKAIKSAASNATNNFGLDYGSLYVAEIQVSDAFRIKRFIPRAKGSASPIVKRNSNLRVVVKERR